MAGSITIQEMKRILSRNPNHANITTFVETGTFRAETIGNMCTLFEKCHTIELSQELYENAKKKLASSSVQFHLGDSVSVLSELVSSINEAAIFFLDAHWCGRESGRGTVDVPLLEEIKLISTRDYNDLLIVDDYRLFSTQGNEDWGDVTVQNVLAALYNKIPRWKRFFPRVAYSIMNDRMIIPL